MAGLITRRLAIVVAGLFASACASPPVSETPALEGETLLELQRSVLTGDELSEVTQQVLNVLYLVDDWEEDPEGTLDRIFQVPGGVPDWRKRVAATELHYSLAKRAEDPAEAHALYLEAVIRARDTIIERLTITAAFDPGQRLLAAIYNRGLARVMMLGQEVYGHPSGWTSFLRPGGEQPIQFIESPNHYRPEDFDSFLAAEELMFEGRIPNRYRQYGVGAALIGVRQEGEHTGREFGQYELPNLQALPVTLVLDVAEDGTLELELLNSFNTNLFEDELGQLPLAADFSAPLGHMIAQLQDPYEHQGLGFFTPEELEAERGIYMMQPYDPARIPVLLVHGLWSSPITWIEVINEIWGDAQLRSRYQIWLYMYPTGIEIPTNVEMFHAQLLEMRENLDPEDDDPAMQDMVVIGHSMGGILTKTLVSTGGDDLWNQIVSVPLDELVASDEERERLRREAYFEPMPFVNRVIFIATPHRGAPMADNFIGAVGDWMISLPSDAVSAMDRLIRDNPGAFEGYDEAHTSIDDLSQSSTTLLALADCPIREGLPYHSIMGDVTGLGPPDCEDGVVAYRSSHLEGAQSEVIVEYGHSAQRHPQAQLEIRRILHEHLDSK